jgi:hypothetical protein
MQRNRKIVSAPNQPFAGQYATLETFEFGQIGLVVHILPPKVNDAQPMSRPGSSVVLWMTFQRAKWLSV